MDPLKRKFEEKAKDLFSRVKELNKTQGDKVIDQVKLGQVFGGMRGIKSMFWETSELDPLEGIRFRGYSIPQLRDLLPKAPGDKEPLPEGLFHLMLVDEIPTAEEVKWLSGEWQRRSHVPKHTYKVIESMPIETHPMTQFIMALSSMQTESVFARRYAQGMSKFEYWDATYEDTMNVVARLPRIAAYIYRRTYKNGEHIEPDISLDWAGNFAHMLGFQQADFKSLMRLYMTIHADHEGGNASAHATHLIGSTLSDAWLSLSGGMLALSGPLHGLANQEVIKWVFQMLEILGTETPSKAQIAEYVQQTLDAGKVIPGYGHAVLRQPDPRFVAQRKFAENYIKDSNIIKVIWNIYEVVPPILQKLGKVKNPWPNVDAHSGALLVHYGMNEFSFYTVLFGVSRALGVLASLCWSRALGLPLERPKSITLQWIEEFLKEEKKAKKAAKKSKA